MHCRSILTIDSICLITNANGLLQTTINLYLTGNLFIMAWPYPLVRRYPPLYYPSVHLGCWVIILGGISGLISSSPALLSVRVRIPLWVWRSGVLWLKWIIFKGMMIVIDFSRQIYHVKLKVWCTSIYCFVYKSLTLFTSARIWIDILLLYKIR